MGYETIIVEKRGRVGWLIFNRPESLNAMSAQLMEETGQAWGEPGGGESGSPSLQAVE